MKRIVIILIVCALMLNAKDAQYAFLKLDQIESSGQAVALAVDNYDRIFVADGNDGIKVYSFNRINGFTEIASIDSGGSAVDVAVDPNGQIVYLANKSDGLRIFAFDNNDFSCIYHMLMYKSSGSDHVYYDNIIRVYSMGNSQIATVRNYKGIDMNRPKTWEYGNAAIYSWNGQELTGMYGYCNPSDPYNSTIDPGNISCFAELDEDNDIIGCGSEGIKLGEYGGSPKSIGEYVYDIHVLDDETILIANGRAGLKAYKYESGFEFKSQIYEGGTALRIHEGTNGVLFLANHRDGIRAYSYDTSFHSLAHIDEDGSARDIDELSDGTIILANDIGLIAYDFADTSSQSPPEIPQIFGLYQNEPNPFNSITAISYVLWTSSDVIVSIFDLFGRKINQWSFQNQDSGIYEITWNGKDQNGNPVPSGVYIYRMKAGSYFESRKMLLMK